MHELGVLLRTVKMVNRLAEQERIAKISFITLEVGEESGFVPMYLEKLFPLAVDSFPAVKGAQLRLQMVSGKGLTIRDIGY